MEKTRTIRSTDIAFDIKVCLFGPSKVGKTCLLHRVVEDIFQDVYAPTIDALATQMVIHWLVIYCD